jgi:outer membrane protein assembly factor BamB
VRAIALSALLALLGCMHAGAAWAQAGDSVTAYHGADDRSGQYVVPGLTWLSASRLQRDKEFDGRVDGHIYAQPLYWHPSGDPHGLLIVATEANNVYALDATTGHIVWHKALGAPVPLDALPCGNIDPLGITGTPVIDAKTGALYLDAVVDSKDGARHKVFGLSLRDGSVLPGWPVDVADALRTRGMSFAPHMQNQRGALAILDGRLFVPYGGHLGDCGDYHGWVVGLRLDHPDGLDAIGAWATRASKGGIWAPGGIAVANGSLFVATGNTEGALAWGDGEAVIRLAPDLHRSTSARDAFAPPDWQRLDEVDLDLGGVNPMPIEVHGRRLIVALGKDGKAYLLDRDNLGGIGGALDVRQVTRRPIITAPASWSTADAAFVAFHGAGADCPQGAKGAGLVTLRIGAASRRGLSTAWCAKVDGEGSPITTTSGDGTQRIVWIAGAEGDDRLHGFRADTGQPVFDGGGPDDRMAGLRHFVTILAANDRLYVAGDGRIYAFKAGQ